MNNNELKTKLEMYLDKDQVYITPLKRVVIESLLDQDDIKSYMSDILKYGCISGSVNGLIYFDDTKAFALKYFDDIVELYQCLADHLGNDISNPMLDNNPLNWLAWFGYEETVRELANELKLEI